MVKIQSKIVLYLVWANMKSLALKIAICSEIVLCYRCDLNGKWWHLWATVCKNLIECIDSSFAGCLCLDGILKEK